MGVGEEGGRVGDRPLFHDKVLGAPSTLKKGSLIISKKKGVLLVGFLKQLLPKEQ